MLAECTTAHLTCPTHPLHHPSQGTTPTTSLAKWQFQFGLKPRQDSFRHVLHLQLVFELPAHQFPAAAHAALATFQQVTLLSPAEQAQPSVVPHSAISVPGGSASDVICQSRRNSKDPVHTRTNGKNFRVRQDTRYPQCYYYYLDKIAGTHILPVTIKVINACFFEACLKVNYADYF